MSLLYIFAATSMGAQTVKRMGSAVNGGPFVRCGANELAIVSGELGPKASRSISEVVLNVRSETFGHRKPDAVLAIGLCGGLLPSLSQRRVVAYTECLSTDGAEALGCSQSLLNAV